MIKSRPPKLFQQFSSFPLPFHRTACYGVWSRPCHQCRNNSSHVKPPKALTPTDSDIPPADHQSLGKSLDLFSSTGYSAGSPLLHPDGSHLFLKLQALLRAQHAQFGFREVVSPTIYKKSLWERSGHWDNYSDDMFEVSGRGARKRGNTVEGSKELEEDETWGLKPMNCPGHCLLFGTKIHSYRDLPIRYADFSPLHRNEVSGSLSGLTRVRRFHQDDGHIFCRPDQVRQEISSTLDMVSQIYAIFGLRPYKLRLSTRPETGFIGTIEDWDRAERQLQDALASSGMAWELNRGDGAFYGPKIDIILRDSHGKEHQTATIQLDFQLPQRFELQYHSPVQGAEPGTAFQPGTPTISTPILIHRAVLGSLERFLALLIEHYEGSFPLWLSPRQVKIITTNTSPEVVKHAQSVASLLSGLDDPIAGSESGPSNPRRLRPLSHLHANYVVEVDAEPKTLARKVANAKKERWCVVCTVGEKEAKAGTVAAEFLRVRNGDGRDATVADLRSEGVDLSAGRPVTLTLVVLRSVLDRMCAGWL